MRQILKSKKGDIPSLLIGLVMILFAVGLSSIIFSRVFLSVLSQAKSQEGLSEQSVLTMTKVEQKTIPILDYLFFFSFVAIVIGLIISSMYIDVHPAIAIIFVLALIIVIVLGGIFSKVFTTIGDNSELSSTYNQFTLTSAIIEHLPLIILVIGVIVVLVLYGKGRGESAGPI